MGPSYITRDYFISYEPINIMKCRKDFKCCSVSFLWKYPAIAKSVSLIFFLNTPQNPNHHTTTSRVLSSFQKCGTFFGQSWCFNVFFWVYGTHVATSLEIEKLLLFFHVVLFQAMIFEIYLSHFPVCVTYDFFVSMFHA